MSETFVPLSNDEEPARDTAVDAARDAAQRAWDAAWALVVRDLITTEQFETLYGPWRKALEGQE